MPLNTTAHFDKITQQITSQLQQRILLLDGAMGTMIQQRNLVEADYRTDRFADHKQSLKGNHDVLSLTRPDVIESIHTAYLNAGADIITTNTFNATSISQADYALSDIAIELNQKSAELARRAVDAFQCQHQKNSVCRWYVRANESHRQSIARCESS